MTVNFSLALSIGAMSISLFSLGFTAYQQYFKGPRISMLIAQRMTACYEHDGRLYLHLSVIFRNKGAQYATIRLVGGQISSETQGTSSSLRWVAFLKNQSSNLSKEGEALRAFASIEAFADVIVVPSRSILTKRIQFITTDKYALQWGAYTINLFTMEGLRTRVSARAAATFNVSDETLNTLAKSRADKNTHVTPCTAVIPLEFKV